MLDRFQTERVRAAVLPVMDLLSLGPMPHASPTQPLAPAPSSPKRPATTSGIPAGFWAVREGAEAGGEDTQRRDAAGTPLGAPVRVGEGAGQRQAHWSASDTKAPARADTVASLRWSSPRQPPSSPAPFPAHSPGAGRTLRGGFGAGQEGVGAERPGTDAGSAPEEEEDTRLVWSILRGGFRYADDSPAWAGISLI
ncbi:hypothetical protein T484DRAFT_1779940 [Baffinella frigidus]|nr:hypothetical protein T484DRAFT_1779940 [Cryptophyta sp. CCMP2293]